VPTIRATDGRPVFNRNLRPVPLQGQYNTRESNAKSLYRALVLQTQYRSRKFTAGAFYTLSTNYSDDDNERNATGMGAMNPYDMSSEYHYSDLDARHVLSAYALYSLPWGFEVSGTLGARSGLPLNPIAGTDTDGNATNNDRPYSAVGVPFLRNSFRNRGVVNNNLRLLKSFSFRERYRVQLSAEFFNFLNLDNVVYAGQANIYGLGINPTTGAAAPVDSRFMLLRNAAGDYNQPTTSQVGNPFQAQFGVLEAPVDVQRDRPAVALARQAQSRIAVGLGERAAELVDGIPVKREAFHAVRRQPLVLHLRLVAA
jgi:hypothetical protein